MIQMIPLKCPNCDAKMDVEEGKNFYFCNYCGYKILIHDDTKKTVTKIIRDEARIKESDNKARVELEQAKAVFKKLENEEKENKNEMIIFIVLGIILLLFPFIATILH